MALELRRGSVQLQQKFAALVDRVEHLRAVQREALRQVEHLFASLLDRLPRLIAPQKAWSPEGAIWENHRG